MYSLLVRIASLLLVRQSLLAGVVALGGVSALQATQDALPQLQVTASLPMVGEWVQAVGGEHVQVSVVAPVGSDPHTFEPSARSMQAVNRGAALFVVGLGLEPWVTRLKLASPALRIVALAPMADLRSIGEHDHSAKKSAHGNHMEKPAGIGDRCPAETSAGSSGGGAPAHVCAHGEYDPHVWLDPIRVQVMVRTIEQTLSARAPSAAQDFKRNADAYCLQLEALDKAIVATLEPISPARRKLVTNHDNLRYFAERYNFVITDTLFGAQGAGNGQPSVRRVLKIVAEIREHNVDAVFADAFSGSNLLEAVAQEAGIGTVGRLYSVPAGASSPASDYLQMMQFNANEIARALGRKQAP